MSQTTEKAACRELMGLLVAHGVTHCVVSPGSRNAPLILAAHAEKRLRKEVVIDERCAAFMALGLASISGKPVALICTSGTAMLNYAPAVAEAYYRHIPLIVITADRPPQWIDQDDSQTIRQMGALDNIVKRAYQVRGELRDSSEHWWANREINDALLFATSAPAGPVHINIPLDEPLGQTADSTYLPSSQRTISIVKPQVQFSPSQMRWMAAELIPPRKVMVIVGFNSPSERLNRALAKLAKLPNVVVLTETIANVVAPGVIERIDSTISVIPPEQIPAMQPDVVITAGGALVSRMIKRMLRPCTTLEHWHVGQTAHTIDCFTRLTRRIDLEPELFFSQLATAMSRGEGSCYASLWAQADEIARKSHDSFIAAQPFTDLVATSELFASIPRTWQVQLSNGTAVRYAQLMAGHHPRRSDCNRGVSGIDGCTSTAVGASLAYDGVTLLVTGDTSMAYDIGALALPQISPKLKIVVLCNGGGSIFRFIDSTRSLPITEPYLAAGVNLPLPSLCQGYGLKYFSAHTLPTLRSAFREFAAESRQPALLAIYTDGLLSAQTLRNYFRRTLQ